MTTLNTIIEEEKEAQKIDDEYLGLAHEAGWHSPDELVIPYSVLVEALTLKDEAHKKEMEEAVREARERIRGHIAEWDDISRSESEFAGNVRYYFRDILTPTKEVTEELTD